MSKTKQQLEKLLDTAKSVNSLPEKQKESVKKTLLSLDETKMEAVIHVLVQEAKELRKIADESKKLAGEMEQLMIEAKQIKGSLDTAFLRYKEQKAEGNKDAKLDDLLNQMEV